MSLEVLAIQAQIWRVFASHHSALAADMPTSDVFSFARRMGKGMGRNCTDPPEEDVSSLFG